LITWNEFDPLANCSLKSARRRVDLLAASTRSLLAAMPSPFIKLAGVGLACSLVAGGLLWGGGQIQAKRHRQEAREKILRMYPYLDRRAVLALDDGELESRPIELMARDTSITTTPSFANVKPDVRDLTPTYIFIGPDGNFHPLETSKARSAPEITVAIRDDLKPRVTIPQAFDEQGKEATYHFEFDTDPSFSSPNVWRQPALVEGAQERDPRSRKALDLDVLRTTLRGVDARQNSISFPFRVTAMRLPAWDKLDFAELEKQSRALAYGLRHDQIVSEVYAYGRQVYLWSEDTVYRSPIDTFVSGLGGCGHVNGLIGTFLEMNGIRYRTVSGFSPRVRVAYPGGGHSAIEVFSPDTRRWSYVDPYLDVFLPGESVESIVRAGKYNDLEIYPVESKFRDLGDSVSLNRLFEYHVYSDSLGRLPTVGMPRLFGRTDDYGLQWKLNTAPVFTAKELFPEEMTIYVRARYVFAGETPVRHFNDFTPPAGPVTASPWGTMSFTVKPLQALGRTQLVQSGAGSE